MKSTELKTAKIIDTVENFLLSHKCIPQKNFIIAYSAGSDSATMLDVLYRLQEKYNITLTAAYYNHKLRDEKEIEKEIEIAQSVCRTHNIELVVGLDADGTIGKLSKERGTEAAAREVRYNFLIGLALERGADYIAFAHNRDDSLENLVIRFFSGSSPEGLTGITDIADIESVFGYSSGNKDGKKIEIDKAISIDKPIEKGKPISIVRPLSTVGKSDILSYLNENQINYSVDSTNIKDNYLRNKVRQKLIPVVKSIFPGYGNSLTDLAEKMSITSNFMNEEYYFRFKWEIFSEESRVSFLKASYSDFEKLHPGIRLKALYAGYNILFPKEGRQRLSYRFLKPLLKEKIDLKSPILLQRADFKLEKEGNELFWKSDIVITNKNRYLLEIKYGKKYKLPFSHKGKEIYIFSEIVTVEECSGNNIWLPCNKIKGSLKIGSRQERSCITLDFGKKKVKKLLNELGIPRDLRDALPIIYDDSGVIAVWGSIFGFKNRIGSHYRYDKNNINDAVILKSRQE